MIFTSYHKLFMLFFLLPAVLSHADNKKAQEDVPIKIAGRVIFVDVTVNNKGPLSFILDTGATETIITPRTAKDVGIRGYNRNKKGTVKSIAVGNAKTRNLKAFLLDPPQALSLRLDHGIDYKGILGYTYLSRFVTTIDYKNLRLHLTPIAKYQRPKTAKNVITVPFRLKNNLIHATGTVNGKGPVIFLVDTGSSEMLLLPKPAKQLGIKASPMKGYKDVGFTHINTITLGKAKVFNVPTIIHTIPQDRKSTPTYHGILGYPFLSNFKVTVNYRDRILLLTPNDKH